jgi:hypothetical protein
MGRITSKPVSFKSHSVERISSYGLTLSCPTCEAALMLKDIKDGDQAYWCHSCNRGWRAGHLPPEARRVKTKTNLEDNLGVIPEPVILEPTPEVAVAQKNNEPLVLIIESAKVGLSKKPRAIKEKSASVVLEAEPVVVQSVSRKEKKIFSPMLEPVIVTPIRKVRTPKIVPEPILSEPETVLRQVRQAKIPKSMVVKAMVLESEIASPVLDPCILVKLVMA